VTVGEVEVVFDVGGPVGRAVVPGTGPELAGGGGALVVAARPIPGWFTDVHDVISTVEKRARATVCRPAARTVVHSTEGPLPHLPFRRGLPGGPR